MNLRRLRVLLMVPLVLSCVYAQAGVGISRWVGPPGSRPGTYQEWVSRHPASELRVVKAGRQAGRNRDQGAVAVICESTLAVALAPELSQYAANLETAGYAVLNYAVSGGTPEALRALLQDAWHSDHIIGALLVGNLPAAWFQVKSIWEPDVYAEWPIDLFFMDLDGTWLDTLKYDPVETLVPGHDGIYDTHTGALAPEISIGRLMTNGIGDSVELLRNYFRKDNAFRHDSVVLPQRALVFIDDDWHDWAQVWDGDVALAFPDRTLYEDQESTRAEVYRRNLDTARNWVSVFAHSWSHGHGFYFDRHRQIDYYLGPEYTNQDPPAQFYNFFACSFGRYTDTGYGGGRSIFNDRYGLGAIATTKAGGMLDFNYFYSPLAQGLTIGEAFRQWFAAKTGGGISPEGLVWSYGMTLLGDPFLEPLSRYDVAPVQVVAPVGAVDSGAVLTPQAIITNCGSAVGDFPVILRIGVAYCDTQIVNSLTPGESLLVSFRPWTAHPDGRLAVVCSTALGWDGHPYNNALRTRVLVYSPDVGVAGILSPCSTAHTIALLPKAGIRNSGQAAETFSAGFRIRDSLGGLVYQDSLSLNMGPGCSQAVSFGVWNGPHAVGRYTAACRVFRPGDRHPENDSAGETFVVVPTEPLPAGWSPQCSVPAGKRRKKVNTGSCMASDEGTVFLLKGSGSNQVYQYSSWEKTWQALESLPWIGRSGKKHGVKKGSALACADGRLYAIKDGKLGEFWEYDPDSAVIYPWIERHDRWGRDETHPGGSGLVALTYRDTPYVFSTRGGTNEFYRYDCRHDFWWPLSHAEVGGPNVFSDGSCLAYDGIGTIYVLVAKTNRLLAYDVSQDMWTMRSSLPMKGRSRRTKKVKSGAGLAAHGGKLFAEKGGSANELWMYDCASDQWTELDSLPLGPAKKRVRTGGALVYDDAKEALYATKGGNTLEFWAYPLSGLGLGIEEPVDPKPSSALRVEDGQLRITPNPFSDAGTISYSMAKPGNISLKLYDATGRLVMVLASGHHAAGTQSFVIHGLSWPAGVYLLKLVTENTATVAKLLLK